MTDFNIYPAVDAGFNFPPEVRGAIAEAQELSTKIDEKTAPLSDDIQAHTESLSTLNETAVFDGDERLPRSSPDPSYSHVWTDKNGRAPLGILTDSTVVAPNGLDTPRAGKTLDDVNNLAFAVTSPDGRVSELALGYDGSVPDWVLSRWTSRMGIDVAGTRNTAYALTVSGSTSNPDLATSVQARLPLKLGADAVIEAIHFRNYADRSGVAYIGALSFAGVYFGEHAVSSSGDLTGNFTSTPTQVSGAGTTPDTGSEYKIDNLSIPVTAGKDYLLSYAYTCAEQSNQSSIGGCWRNENVADVSSATAVQTISKFAPLDVWLEIRVADETPLIAYMGDSLSCGVSADLPVYHSYPVRHAQMNGYIPVMYTHSGSAMTSWTNVTAVKYTKWSALNKPDSLVVSLGKNDLITATETTTLRERFNALYAVVSNQLTKKLYLTTILPSLDDATPEGAVRREWNSIIKSELLGNAVAVFDLADSVKTASGGLDPLYDSGDGVHLNKSGYAKNAIAINQPLHR